MKSAEAVSEILKSIVEKAKPGVNLLELEHLAESTMQVLGVQSANKGYQPKWANTPFPSVICLGVNDVIAHPIPVSYDLQEGDLLHIDTGIMIDEMCGDAGLTIPIGEIGNKDERLLRYAKRALYKGIEVVRQGIKVTEIGEAIYTFARQSGYVVNKRFFGHGIGKTMHEGLQIPHFPLSNEEVKLPNGKYEYKEPTKVPVLEVGQIICIEPMLTYKDEFGKPDADGWTYRTRDGKKSAFFEHMIRVTPDGHEILTSHIKEVIE